MADSCARFIVIHVLQAYGVTVTARADLQDVYILEGRGVLEEHTMREQVGRRKVRHFSRKFKIAIHLFWHPEQAPSTKADAVQ